MWRHLCRVLRIVRCKPVAVVYAAVAHEVLHGYTGDIRHTESPPLRLPLWDSNIVVLTADYRPPDVWIRHDAYGRLCGVKLHRWTSRHSRLEVTTGSVGMQP